MVRGDTRRIVVIKGIPSNLIEEAILILKKEPECHPKEKGGQIQKKGRRPGEDLLVKEAEAIINCYIKEHQGAVLQGVSDKTPVKPWNALKKSKYLNTAINLALLGSACLLIFLITRLV